LIFAFRVSNEDWKGILDVPVKEQRPTSAGVIIP
jgi:hypothetical protein